MNKLSSIFHLTVGLAVLGTSYNASTPQERFANLKSALGILVGYYSFVFNWYYNTNPRVYGFVNRYLLLVRRTRTFWDMNLEFAFESRPGEQLSKLLGELEAKLLESKLGKLKIESRTVDRMKFVLDTGEDEVGFIVHLEDGLMTVCLDRKITVPLDAFSDYQNLLIKIAEKMQFVVKPDRVLCNVQVYFRQGKPNPFYGFFVNRIPARWLETFHVVFRVDRHPDCRIEASTDHVGVQADSLTNLFSGLEEVLTFQALPSAKEAE